MLFDRWLPLDYRRRRLLAKTAAGPLYDYLRVAFPSLDADCRTIPLLAVDLETTGLNAQQDEILSIGLVTIQGLEIELATARHYLIKPTRQISEQSVVIHHITDDRAQQGRPLAEVFDELLQQLAGKVLVAHHARFELSFIDAACMRLYNRHFITPVIDTLTLEQRRRQRSNRVYRSRELRLDALRQKYNLPRYRAHNALSDALGAAELFLAQIAQGNGSQRLPLEDYLMRY